MEGRLASRSCQKEKFGEESKCTKAQEKARIASKGNEFLMAVSTQARVGICGRYSRSENLRAVPSMVRKYGACYHHYYCCPIQTKLPQSRSVLLPNDCKGSLHIQGTGTSCVHLQVLRIPEGQLCILREKALPKGWSLQLPVPPSPVTAHKGQTLFQGNLGRSWGCPMKA